MGDCLALSITHTVPGVIDPDLLFIYQQIHHVELPVVCHIFQHVQRRDGWRREDCGEVLARPGN